MPVSSQCAQMPGINCFEGLGRVGRLGRYSVQEHNSLVIISY